MDNQHAFDYMGSVRFTVRKNGSMLNHLRAMAVFAKTVEHSSFRKAAKELQLSPSVVSHHISQLEEQLGVTLLYRSTRTLSLTRDGERLIDAARSMVEVVEAGIHAVLDNASQLSGELRVTAPAVLAQSPITDRIALFLRQHPDVRVSVDYSDKPRDVVAESIDVAIRMGWLRDSALKARKLYDVERVLLASTSYLKGRSVPKSPKDVEEWDWLELASVPLKPVFRHENHRTVSLRPNAQLSSNSAFAAYQLARCGAGLAILPRVLADADLLAGKMEIVLPHWELEKIAVYAVRPANSARDGLSAAFVEFMAT